MRADTGHQSLTVWQLLVLGLNPYKDDDIRFSRQTLIDNVSLLTLAILCKVNVLVVATSNKVMQKGLARARLGVLICL